MKVDTPKKDGREKVITGSIIREKEKSGIRNIIMSHQSHFFLRDNNKLEIIREIK